MDNRFRSKIYEELMISKKDIEKNKESQKLLEAINKRFNKKYKKFSLINDTLFLKE